MNQWPAGIAALLAIAAFGCSGPTVVSSDQNIAVAPDQGTITATAPAVASLNLPSATVVSVGDGDTLRMDYRGENITVRLSCIDAPETSQTPWGPAATDRLRQLTPRGSTIQFREADTDRYGRMVAEIYANGQNINLQLVREGHAVVYTQFLHRCPDTRDDLLAAEEQARQQRLNYWSQDNPVMPWDYRRNRSSAPAGTNQDDVAVVPQTSDQNTSETIGEPRKPAPANVPPETSRTPVRKAVSGSCECPYDQDSAGRFCGKRSAYSRPGGAEPTCYIYAQE